MYNSKIFFKDMTNLPVFGIVLAYYSHNDMEVLEIKGHDIFNELYHDHVLVSELAGFDMGMYVKDVTGMRLKIRDGNTIQLRQVYFKFAELPRWDILQNILLPVGSIKNINISPGRYRINVTMDFQIREPMHLDQD